MSPRSIRPVAALAAAALCLGAALLPKHGVAKAPFTLEPDDQVETASISNNGRWLSVVSRATNLVEDGSDSKNDVFLIDTKKGDVIQVSRTWEGGDSGQTCQRASISPNGRYVVYDSADSGLIDGDELNTNDVFLYDRNKQTTVRVSTALNGGGATMAAIDATVSNNGRWVAFSSKANLLATGDLNNKVDVFVRDVKAGVTRVASLTSTGAFADADSEDPRLSGNGRFVLFSSLAALVPEDTNGKRDVYRVDLKKDLLELVSVVPDGSAASNSDSGNGQLDISDNGRYVTFTSGATNLGPSVTALASVFRRDMKKGTTELVNATADGTPSAGIASTHALSPDGHFVVFGSLGTDLGPVDTNAIRDLYLKDMKKGTVTRITQGVGGMDVDDTSESPSVSSKAKHVAFRSLASTLIEGDVDDVQADVFVWRP